MSSRWCCMSATLFSLSSPLSIRSNSILHVLCMVCSCDASTPWVWQCLQKTNSYSNLSHRHLPRGMCSMDTSSLQLYLNILPLPVNAIIQPFSIVLLLWFSVYISSFFYSAILRYSCLVPIFQLSCGAGHPNITSYPGLLNPVFVACSTNAGEGLVKLGHVVWRTWTCGGVAPSRKNSKKASALPIVNTDRRTTEHSISDSLGDVSWI